MTNITAFSLVLTLAIGAPVANVVCVTGCQQEPATSDHFHEDMASSAGPMVAAGSDCREPSISESPYLVEHRALPGPAVLITTPSLTTPAPIGTDEPAVFLRASDAWLKPPLVLRI